MIEIDSTFLIYRSPLGKLCGQVMPKLIKLFKGVGRGYEGSKEMGVVSRNIDAVVLLSCILYILCTVITNLFSLLRVSGRTAHFIRHFGR